MLLEVSDLKARSLHETDKNICCCPESLKGEGIPVKILITVQCCGTGMKVELDLSDADFCFSPQLEDAGSSSLDNLLSRYITGSHFPPQPTSTMNPSPGPSALSPGSSGKSDGFFQKFQKGMGISGI